jgi:hypothetical protein
MSTDINFKHTLPSQNIPACLLTLVHPTPVSSQPPVTEASDALRFRRNHSSEAVLDSHQIPTAPELPYINCIADYIYYDSFVNMTGKIFFKKFSD